MLQSGDPHERGTDLFRTPFVTHDNAAASRIGSLPLGTLCYRGVSDGI